MLKSTSFSRLKEFRECPLKAKLKFVDKIPDPRPDPPPGQEHPMDRGSRIHEMAENYVKGTLGDELPRELERFKAQLNILRLLYPEGKVDVELQLALDKNWARSDPRDFENTKYRMIADVVLYADTAEIVVIDHKTGRKDGNEVVHTQQGMDYLSAMAIANVEIQKFNFEVWYLDKGEVLPTISFTRDELNVHIRDFMEEHTKLLECRFFPPTPSFQACLWCPFKKGTVGRGKAAYAGTGHCTRNCN